MLGTNLFSIRSSKRSRSLRRGVLSHCASLFSVECRFYFCEADDVYRLSRVGAGQLHEGSVSTAEAIVKACAESYRPGLYGLQRLWLAIDARTECDIQLRVYTLVSLRICCTSASRGLRRCILLCEFNVQPPLFGCAYAHRLWRRPRHWHARRNCRSPLWSNLGQCHSRLRCCWSACCVIFHHSHSQSSSASSRTNANVHPERTSPGSIFWPVHWVLVVPSKTSSTILPCSNLFAQHHRIRFSFPHSRRRENNRESKVKCCKDKVFNIHLDRIHGGRWMSDDL